jgi:GNAT superfamily N-acetyltransferase
MDNTMRDIVIRECSPDELANASNFDGLCAEYAAESGIAEFGEHKVDLAMYRAIEATGIGCCIGAWRGDELVGFVALTLTLMPHYSQIVGSVVSHFVASSARKGGTGTRIRQFAERIAAERGAVGMMLSAPLGSRLDAILPRSGYRATHHLYFKGFAQ